MPNLLFLKKAFELFALKYDESLERVLPEAHIMRFQFSPSNDLLLISFALLNVHSVIFISFCPLIILVLFAII